MTLSLTNHIVLPSCRLFLLLLTETVCAYVFSRRSGDKTCILGANKRLHGTTKKTTIGPWVAPARQKMCPPVLFVVGAPTFRSVGEKTIPPAHVQTGAPAIKLEPVQARTKKYRQRTAQKCASSILLSSVHAEPLSWQYFLGPATLISAPTHTLPPAPIYSGAPAVTWSCIHRHYDFFPLTTLPLHSSPLKPDPPHFPTRFLPPLPLF
jgi:hypothetical protein